MEAIDSIYKYRDKIRKKYHITDSNEEIREVGYEVSCLSCGEMFIVSKDTKGLFCSRNCHLEYTKKFVTRPCPICGTMFTVKFCRRRVKYCSKECSIKASSLARKGQKRTDELKQKISESQKVIWEKRRNGEMALRNSEIWHTEEWKKAQSERLKQLHRDGKIVCPWKKVSQKDEELIIEYYLDFYSSNKIAEMLEVSKGVILRCLHKNQIPTRPVKGEFHPSWKGGKYSSSNKNYGNNWHRVKQEVLERDNHECQLCGSKARLEVHHIIPIRLFSAEEKETKGNDKNNLIVLCLACHRVEHYILKQNELKNVA